MSKNIKIACYVSGPFRYCDEIIKSINKEINRKGIDIDIFIHIWTKEIGKKSRGISNNLGKLYKANNVIRVLEEEPFQEEVIIDLIKAKLGHFSYEPPFFIGASSINNMFGMFHAINRLDETRRQTGINYTHILRMRTDILFFKDLLPNNIRLDTVYVSNNPIVNYGTISDHTMLLPINFFNDIWGNNGEFVLEFSKYGFNPELLLTNRIKSKKIPIINYWSRYKDYFVVYDKMELKINSFLTIKSNNVFDNKLNFFDKAKLSSYFYFKNSRRFMSHLKKTIL